MSPMPVTPLAAARPALRTLAALAVATAALAAAPRAAAAQDEPAHARPSRFEFVVSSGSLVPTGTQRDLLARGNLTAAQLTYLVMPNVAVTTTVGWARSRDIASAGEPKLDVFTYDLGAELRGRTIGSPESFSFRPFAGAGAGARTYNYRRLSVDATNNVAAYGSVGGELGYRRVRLRLEARNYVTGFKPMLAAGSSSTRNDVALLAGLRFTAR